MIIDLQVVVTKNNSDIIFKCTEIAKGKGLDGMCFIFNEDYFYIYKEIEEIAEKNNVKFFAGLQIKTKKGALFCIPSFLNEDFFNKSWLKEKSVDKLSENELCDCFHQSGGIVLSPHPYERKGENNFGDYIFNLTSLDGVFTINSRMDRIKNNLAIESALSMKIPALGGSGEIEDLAEIGKAASLFLHDINTQQDIINAIKKDEVWAVEISSFFFKREMSRRKTYSFRRRNE